MTFLLFDLVNLENIYGPYCNAENTYTPDAGVVRYAGLVNERFNREKMQDLLCRTPWTGKCELNLQSCCLPSLTNVSAMTNLSISTRFYIRLLKPPLCSTETVFIQAAHDQTVDKHFFFPLISQEFHL